MIEIAVGKYFRENHEDKHKRDAKNGWLSIRLFGETFATHELKIGVKRLESIGLMDRTWVNSFCYSKDFIAEVKS